MRPIQQTITVNGASTGAWWPLDIYNPNQVTTISANLLSGTANYSIEYTNEDVWNLPAAQCLAVAHPDASFSGATGSHTASTTTLMRAVRVKTASGTGTLRVTVTQQSTA